MNNSLVFCKLFIQISRFKNISVFRVCGIKVPRTTVTLELYNLLRLAFIPFPFSAELFDDMIPIYIVGFYGLFESIFSM